MLGCHAAGVTSEVNLGFHYMQATEHTSKGINLAFEPRADVARSQNSGISGPTKRTDALQNFQKTKT